MPRPRSLFSSLLVVVLLAVQLPALAEVPGSSEPSRLLVSFRDPVDADIAAGLVPGARVVGVDDVDHSAVQVLEFDRPGQREHARALLAADDRVVAVEPDRMVRPDMEVHEVLPLMTDASINLASTSRVPPPSWGVDNDGGSIAGNPAMAGIDVGGELAAQHADGRGVVVAVIDTGVDIDHPLLRDRIWENPGEQADGRDTDGNGYVDDVHGVDVLTGTGDVFVDGDRDAHGTHVAAIIAAASHREVGFRSVAPAAKIMPVRFIDGDRGGRASDAIASVRYAIANGADVINASWGSSGASPALERVLAESPVPVVVSAGNLGAPLEQQPWFPAAHGIEHVAVVAAVAPDGRMADYSSTSRVLVDVAAPGSHITSAWPGERLAVASGTSQAAPHVAGILAIARQRHPDASPAELVAALRATVRPLDGVTDTIAGGIARAPGVLAALGTDVPGCPGIDPTRLPFGDVSGTSPHRPAIACLLDRGVTNGVRDDAFGSDRSLSRAQIASLTHRALREAGVDLPAPSSSAFSDVAAGGSHREAIEALAAAGIVEAARDDRYEPDRDTTRAELAAVVVRAAAHLADGEVRVRSSGFPDVDHDSPIGELIGAAAGLGIVEGRTDGTFSPEAPVRRDQAASMIARLLDAWTQQGLLVER